MSHFTDKFDDKIVKLLKAGAVGFMPSDTIYGLSAVALNQGAIERIYRLKGRDDHKPCIILLADANQATQLGINPGSLSLVSALWPAPLTFIAPAGNAPQFLHRGLQTLAVRVPNSRELINVLAQTGPLVSTSANLQDEPVSHSMLRAKEYFGDKVDFYVDGGTLSGKPSTIVQAENGRLRVIRPGAYKM